MEVRVLTSSTQEHLDQTELQVDSFEVTKGRVQLKILVVLTIKTVGGSGQLLTIL